MPPTNPYAHPHTKGQEPPDAWQATFDHAGPCIYCGETTNEHTCGGGVVMRADRTEELTALLRRALPLINRLAWRSRVAHDVVADIRTALGMWDG